MHLIKRKDVDLYIGAEPHDKVKRIKEYFFNDPRCEELVRLHSKASGLEKIAILFAHGNSQKGVYQWHDNDEDTWKNVQEWIDTYDGKYPALLVSVCAGPYPQKPRIHSKESIVLHPEGHLVNLVQLKRFIKMQEGYKMQEVTRFCKEMGGFIVNCYMPGIGYLDSAGIDAQIKRLKRKLKKLSSLPTSALQSALLLVL